MAAQCTARVATGGVGSSAPDNAHGGELFPEIQGPRLAQFPAPLSSDAQAGDESMSRAQQFDPAAARLAASNAISRARRRRRSLLWRRAGDILLTATGVALAALIVAIAMW